MLNTCSRWGLRMILKEWIVATFFWLSRHPLKKSIEIGHISFIQHCQDHPHCLRYIYIYHKTLLFMCLYWTTISNQHYELKNFLRALPNKLLGIVFGKCSVYMKCTFPSVCMYRNSSACLACSCLDKIYAWWQHIMLMKRTSNLSWVIKLEVTLFGAYDLDFNQMQK